MSQVIMKSVVLILIILVEWFVFAGLPPKTFEFLQHKTWTIEDGLPINSLTKIIQTADGYLWIGTESGLVRFDGVEFDVFNHENAEVFVSNLVIDLLEDTQGTLWVATRGDGVIRYKDGIFTAIKEEDGLLSNKVWCLMKSVDGSVWIGSKGGINRCDKGTITSVPLPGTLSSPWVTYLLEDKEGRVWVGTNKDGLVIIEHSGNEFEGEHIGPPAVKVNCLLEDRQGAVWVGTVEKGLLKYWESQFFYFTKANGLSVEYIQSLFEDRSGNLWIGTYGGGINILPAEKIGQNKDRIIYPLPRQQEFPSQLINRIFQDQEGTMWIAALGGGLNSLRNTKIQTYTTRNGLLTDNVYGVFQDSKDTLWIGTRDQGVNYIKDNRFLKLTMKDGLSSNAVVTITESPAGVMWFGTLGGGINRFLDGNFRVYDLQSGLASNFFRCLYTDAGGELWAGSVDGHIYHFTNETFTLLTTLKSRVNTLLKDANGFLWAGTFDSGLYRVDPGNGKIEVFDSKTGLANDTVLCIHEDERSPGILWIGTIAGLNRLQDGKLTTIRKKDGLPDETVYWILEDHKYDFWISSNRGIYRTKRKEIDDFLSGSIQAIQPFVFGTEHGMRSIECNGGNHPAGWKSRDGKLWFPTTHGLSVIDSINMGINRIPPPVVIKKFLINGQNYPVQQTILIPPGQNDLEFHYAALSFIVPKKIRYKFKLEGYDKDWQNTAERSVRYTNLPAGSYRFLVTACNSDGIWNETGAVIQLRLKSKFYKSVVFIIIILVCAALIVFLYYCYTKKCNLRTELEQKLSRSKLTQDQTSQYVKRILYLLEVEKIYKEPSLSIKSLSSRLIISQKNLSNIINDQLKTNFFDLVSQYRLKEAQRLLIDPKAKDKSVIDIAYEVGYNSKSAFNRAFKNFTCMTPSQYRKKTTNSG